jgi:D-alanyl-D-alanine carboxypeptidase
MKRPARRLAALCLAVLLLLPCLPISAHAASTGTTTAYVNLRTGPGTDYTILETVPLGAQISILDTGNPGWYRVTAPSGNSGYMCSDYILASGGDAGTSTVLFTARTTAFVNLRAGPGTGYGIYLTVPLGDTVSVLDTANAGWYRVQYGSYTGYMSADYLQTQSAAAPTPAPPDTSASADPIGTARTTAVLNIRTGPSTGYRSLGLLDNGETVTVLENCGNGWYAVRTSSNTFGYCSGDYLRVTLGTSPAPQPEPTPQPSEPDTATRWNGRTTAFVNLRSGPSTGYRIYLTVPLGDAITILDRSNSGWYRVQYGSYTGYMSSDYIDVLGAVEETPTTPSSEPDADTRWNGRTTAFVNLRSGPSTGYRIYLTVPLGDAITILDRSNAGWYRVQYGSYTGYMSSDYIDVLGAVQDTPPAEEDTATRWNGRTTAFVNLRSGPSTGYRIYLTVPLGDAITILDRSNSGWYRVQYGSYTGYMSSDYIQVLGTVEETPDPTVPTPPPAGTVDVSDPLLLVNPWNAVPEDYAVSLVSIGDGESVDQRCYGDLMQMLDDCAVYGNAQPYVCSSYRTNDTQTRLYENKVDRLIAQGYSPSDARTEAAKAVAIPGTSEHQLGLAVDIVDLRYQVLDAGQEDTATQQWLMQNSWKYGFILRYPNDKTAVTGIIYEPWHYRYVGRENAKAIYESGLCLEEYLQAQGK